MEPISPFEKRRPVPWTGFDAVLIFSLWIALTQVGIGLLLYVFTEPAISTKMTAVTPTTEHPLSQLLEQGRKSPIILFVAFFSGVIASPLTEEFLFRLLFQGWLSKYFSNFWTRNSKRKLFFSFLPGMLSIFIVSIIFAMAHAGIRTEQPVNIQFYSVLGIGIVNLFVFGFGVVFLRISYRITLSELGFQTNQIFSDLLVAIGTFILSAPFVFGLHTLLRNNFPESVTDPIPLFIFSVILGILYYRSGRLLPCFALHAFLNGFSFLLFFL